MFMVNLTQKSLLVDLHMIKPQEDTIQMAAS